ncbi:MAG: cation:proton antiporter [Candidatus Woesearchaeota archaeon]
MEILILILVLLTASFIISKFFSYIKIPPVLGPIIIGIFLGIPYVKAYLTSGNFALLEYLSNVGIIFLMFYLGLKFDFLSLQKNVKKPLLISAFAFIIPLLIGYFVSFFLFKLSMIESVIIGFSISISSAAVTVMILKDQNLINSRLGNTLIGAALIDDVFGFLVILGIITMKRTYQNPEIGFLLILFDFLIFISLIYIVRYLIVPAVLTLIEKRNQKVDLFVVSVIMALLMTIISDLLKVDSVLGAFLAGMIVRYTLLSGGRLEYKEEKDVTELIEVATFGFLAPFFFIWLGINFDILQFIQINPILAIIIIVAALFGKFIGVSIGNMFSGGNFQESLVYGWGMNMRGGLELVLIEIARASAFISGGIFSAIIVMTIITTFISSVFFKNDMLLYKSANRKRYDNPKYRN